MSAPLAGNQSHNKVFTGDLPTTLIAPTRRAAHEALFANAKPENLQKGYLKTLRALEAFEGIVDELRPTRKSLSKEAEAQGRLPVAQIEEALNSSRWSPELELDGIVANSRSPIKNHFLFGHGDTPIALDSTRRVLDELATDFITELCFEAHRAAQVAGRQKVKLEDVKFACRKSPVYLGKIEEIFGRKEIIDKAKKLVDMNDDKITKSNVLGLEEEPLGAADDDGDLGSVSGTSPPPARPRSKKLKITGLPRQSPS